MVDQRGLSAHRRFAGSDRRQHPADGRAQGYASAAIAHLLSGVLTGSEGFDEAFYPGEIAMRRDRSHSTLMLLSRITLPSLSDSF
jgi:hypothetical protein